MYVRPSVLPCKLAVLYRTAMDRGQQELPAVCPLRSSTEPAIAKKRDFKGSEKGQAGKKIRGRLQCCLRGVFLHPHRSGSVPYEKGLQALQKQSFESLEQSFPLN